MKALIGGYISGLQVLLSKDPTLVHGIWRMITKADVPYKTTLLRQSIEQHDPLALKPLLEAGADATYCPLVAKASHNRTPIELAARVDFTDGVRILLDHGAHVLETDCLESASGNGNNEMVLLLLNAGMDVNTAGTKSPLCYTPLQAAVAHQRVETVKLLLFRHAEKDIFNITGRTAVDWAKGCLCGLEQRGQWEVEPLHEILVCLENN